MQMLRLLAFIAMALAAAVHLAFAADQQQEHFVPLQSLKLTQSEARSQMEQLSRQFVDALYDLRADSENRASFVSNQARANGGNDNTSNNEDDTTAKLINKAARAFRPIVKEFASVVYDVLPIGPARELIKATADSVDSLVPLILKYALGF
ncbi:hypothetical protein COEREDRAFT_85047 [Coemansia reversa NRRL 1564]|uniref:Uncharacterized protein n=1 Tax=Coemansia reversa (strain ATCC 12441 / NRRL 1564) TaxID=763665 RepID=A0A2G5BHR9_COERN|nr:hypothetical protein COEREDRAFT_85047 [Coemansia reversa NRRL 1564]|eukprot:PIA18568.1 hypothetical protein COEREDRAFT_85047 [Coemansia reversa NRRL 1564]